MLRCAALFLFAISAFAQKPTFTVGWSVYAGWTPYHYMNKSGLLRKWADKYGIAITVKRFDYAPSLDAFVAKNIDACTMTNMEALDMPAASGVPTTAILIGDYSNGNDAILVRNGVQLKDLPGKKMLLVQKTVSEYLFDRAMTIAGLRDQTKKVRAINTSDSDIAGAFIADTSASAVVTWKPLVSQIAKQKGVTSLFDSSKIPGEILDLTVVRTEVLNRPDGSGQKFAKALTGAWYEMLAQMSNDKVLAGIAEGSQDTLASYKEQLTHHQNVLHGEGSRGLRGLARDEGKDGAGPPVLLRSRPARRHDQSGGRCRHQVPRRRGPGQSRPRPAGLRRELYEGGGRGKA